MKKYTLGIDYGTLSARALLIDIADGKEIASSEYVYPHAILTDEHFDGISLGKDTAFQHPDDYLCALKETVGNILAETGISSSDILGLGIDFTSCTVLPATEDGTPLCFIDKFKNDPQAYVKLWKHHGAQKEADKITSLARERGEEWLDKYGGKVSSEWLFPKLCETLNKSPEVFDSADVFIEAADWLVWLLTGERCRSSCMAGYKALWDKKNGYPSDNFLRELDPRLSGVVGTKISENVLPAGTKAGCISTEGAILSGLAEGTPVTVPIIDAHAALPSAGVVRAGELMLIIGTSSCHIVLGKKDIPIPGICGSVEDGVIPGYVAFEAGQTCVGDSFDWFVKNCVSESYAQKARAEGKDIFSYLTEKAKLKAPGESGILVLDWWNGSRSPYADSELSGTIIGLTLATRPEDIYRGIIESTAFGTKAIIDLYEKHGIKIEKICAAGGISQKNPFLMQIYADVLGREIRVTESTQAGAKGSAILAAAACGYYGSVEKAADVLSDKCEKVYHPDPENTEKYAPIYKEYVKLSEYFTKENDVMKRLR